MFRRLGTALKHTGSYLIRFGFVFFCLAVAVYADSDFLRWFIIGCWCSSYAFQGLNAKRWRQVALDWREVSERWEKLYKAVKSHNDKVFAGTITSLLESYCEDTELTNYYTSVLDDGKLVIKIGDDEHMVEVDMDYAVSTGFVEALEKAKLEWTAKKSAS